MSPLKTNTVELHIPFSRSEAVMFPIAESRAVTCAAITIRLQAQVAVCVGGPAQR